ncbi:7TM diverse intracellular signaling domain-containing protein [Bacillus sp. 31A1R]|uniref:7TM diverse intracellular signaling domain-containing protein n=1 Tax=Robertmurraya mangrovi TaxID=3098077 RepID=A0ABU5IXW5_9BACI|nr:7TM diverse intracellular signaling domain-containing protein [Bacillus sp. 31A1R]MDZ5472008.1 7TM diverse intracellular signaling domain-containing protein [Bacillus sp. 31A1R]
MKKFIFISLFVLLILNIPYMNGAAANDSIILLSDNLSHGLTNDIYYLEDKNHEFSIQDVSEKDGEFQPLTTNSPNFGYTSSAYWLRFTMKNQSSISNWMLEVGSPPLDYLSLYLPKKEGTFSEIHYGDLYPFSKREVNYRNFIFNLEIKPGEQQTYYLRVETEGAMSFPISIHTEKSILSKSLIHTAIHFLYYGLVLIMSIYNFFLFVFLRNKSYLYYALFSLSFMFIPMSNLGDAYQWLWPDSPWWNNRSIVFFMCLSIILSCVFVMRFLDTKEYLPKFHLLLKIFSCLQLITIFILLFISYPIALKVVVFTSILHAPLFLFLGIRAYYKKHILAKYFLLAWVLFLIGNTISTLSDAGMIKEMFFTKYAVFIGSSSELLLFSIGLAAQVDRIRKQKEKLDFEAVETQKEVVFTMGEVIEARSKETSNHVKRVAEYSKIIAQGYGLAERECEYLKMASPMHDIGKIGIPDAILNKPGKLTSEEFELIKTHTTIGYGMLKHSSRDIFKIAAVIAHQHHEKFDGTGYPQGLKGKQIDIHARITALADVFDALGSDRVYKKAWELDQILNLINEERGKHFDPKLVDVFFENIESLLSIKEKFPD